jgi:hypothetical protein
MKHLTIFLLIIFPSLSFSQLPDGTISPDWTASDIYGEEWNLYEILAEGKSVILDFGATWCAPCWSYHENGPLKELYNEFGPTGTDELMVFMIECDPNNTIEDIYGTGGNTLGNWVEGTNYPIIDDGTWIYWLYENSYYPTVYMICPNGGVKEFFSACKNEFIDYMYNNCGECQDQSACNYNTFEVLNEECLFPGSPCNDSGANYIDGFFNENCDCEEEGCEVESACNFSNSPGLNCDFYSCSEVEWDEVETFEEYNTSQIAYQSEKWTHWPEGASYQSAALVSNIGDEYYLWGRDNSPDASWGSPTNIFRSFDFDMTNNNLDYIIEVDISGSKCYTWTYRLWGENWGEPWGEGYPDLIVDYVSSGILELTSIQHGVVETLVNYNMTLRHVVSPNLGTIETWVDGVVKSRISIPNGFKGIQLNPQKGDDFEEAYFLVSEIRTAVVSSLSSPGCTDENACNYDQYSNYNNGTCHYYDAIGVCGGNCLLDNNQDGICDSQCNEDFDNDGAITVHDLLLVLTDFGCNLFCNYDANFDGITSVEDILLILGSYGTICDN